MRNNMGASLAVLGVVISLSTPAGAQTRPGFEVGAQAFDYRYRERQDGEIVAKDDGKFIGFTGSYVETVGQGSFVRAVLHSSGGSVDYSSSDGRINDVSQYVAEVEFHIGHDFTFEGGALTAFAGVGGRALDDNSGGKQTADGVLGYDREIAYSYLPVGLASRIPLGAKMSLKASAQYNHILSGKAKSKLSDVDQSLPDLSLRLKNGHGVRASAALAFAAGRREITVGPFIRKWTVESSETKIIQDLEAGLEYQFSEPKNKTTEVGLQIAIAF